MRKSRIGEYVCKCSAYNFPHRFGGGKCVGRFLVEDYWNDSFGGGTCRSCHALTDDDGIASCQVFNGAEHVKYCLVWQEFVEAHEIRIGVSLAFY